MPSQPPRFAAKPPRKKWQLPDGATDRRLRGRAGMRLRQQVRNEEPFCRMCLARDVYRRTDEIDHIKPLALGGTDERSNLQGLCAEHHDEKSKAERAALRGG